MTNKIFVLVDGKDKIKAFTDGGAAFDEFINNDDIVSLKRVDCISLEHNTGNAQVSGGSGDVWPEVEWNNAPHWANYHAIDADGTGRWYSHHPTRITTINHITHDSWAWVNDYSVSLCAYDDVYNMQGVTKNTSLTVRPH